MTTLRCAVAALILGTLCIAASLMWPEIEDPRAGWTEEKSADYTQTNREIHTLAHSLATDVRQTENSPGHIHTASESAEPWLSALQLERARERSEALSAELVAAREIPPGWHLLLGLVGGVFVILGIVLATSSQPKVPVALL